MSFTRTAWIVLALAGMATPAAAQTMDAGAFKLKLLGRMQAQFNTTSVDEQELVDAGRSPSAIPASTFEIRRIRFGAELEHEDWLTGKLEMEFGMARLATRDAYVNMGFSDAFEVRIGQFKKPFSLLQLTSSSVWPVIERGVRIRGLADALALEDSLAGGTPVLSRYEGGVLFGEEQDLLESQRYQAFDLGASVHGRIGGFGYHAGIFNGAGGDRTDDTDSKALAARVTYKFASRLPVTVGAGVSHRQVRLASRPVITERDGTAYEADLEIGAFAKPGLHVLAEVSKGRSFADGTSSFTGAHAIVAHYTALENKRFDGLEFAARASYGDPSDEKEGDEGLLLTPGVNLYFFGRNRLMLNWDFYRADPDRFSNQNAIRAQAQFYF